MAKCDTPENLKRQFGTGFKIKMVSDSTRHQQYFKQNQGDIKMLFEKKMVDTIQISHGVFEETKDQDETTTEQGIQ